MTLGPHPDPVGRADQAALRFSPVREQVGEEVGMEVAVEWAEAWVSWVAPEDLAGASLVGDPHSDPRPTPDHTTSWALEGYLALVVAVEEGVGEAEEVVDSPPVAPLSSTCHQTSVRLCTRGPDSIPCCPQEGWGGPEEVVRPTLGSACLHSSSTDKVDTHSTALRYLEAEAPEVPRMGPCLQWEEAWAPG